jgi:hypothetical protein
MKIIFRPWKKKCLPGLTRSMAALDDVVDVVVVVLGLPGCKFPQIPKKSDTSWSKLMLARNFLSESRSSSNFLENNSETLSASLMYLPNREGLYGPSVDSERVLLTPAIPGKRVSHKNYRRTLLYNRK